MLAADPGWLLPTLAEALIVPRRCFISPSASFLLRASIQVEIRGRALPLYASDPLLGRKPPHQISSRQFRVKSCRDSVNFWFFSNTAPLHSRFYDHLPWPTPDRAIVKDQILFLIVRLSRNLIEVVRVPRAHRAIYAFLILLPGERWIMSLVRTIMTASVSSFITFYNTLKV